MHCQAQDVDSETIRLSSCVIVWPSITDTHSWPNGPWIDQIYYSDPVNCGLRKHNLDISTSFTHVSTHPSPTLVSSDATRFLGLCRAQFCILRTILFRMVLLNVFKCGERTDISSPPESQPETVHTTTLHLTGHCLGVGTSKYWWTDSPI